VLRTCRVDQTIDARQLIAWRELNWRFVVEDADASRPDNTKTMIPGVNAKLHHDVFGRPRAARDGSAVSFKHDFDAGLLEI
jgi:hypothetical protein